MREPYWEHFEHGADIGVRGAAATLSSAFEQTAIAMTAVITDPQHVAATENVTIECTSPDKEILLVDWLNDLIYEMATRNMVFSRFKVTIDNDKLIAIASGEFVDVEKHQPAVEVKGATFTELKVAQQPSGLWVAQCVIDV